MLRNFGWRWWFVLLAVGIGCARAELKLLCEVDGRILPVVGVEGDAIVVERDGSSEKVTRGAVFRIEGELVADASLVHWSQNYSIYRARGGEQEPERRQMEGSVGMRSSVRAGSKHVRNEILTLWPVAKEQAGILLAAWVVEGQVERIMAEPVSAVGSEQTFSNGKRFALTPVETEGQGVLFFWCNGAFVPPVGPFKNAAANRAADALTSGDAPGLKRALDELGDVKIRGAHDVTLLHLAAEAGADEAVKLLLDRGAQMKATTDDGRTPLHWAAAKGRLAVIKTMLATGVKVDGKDDTEATALQLAVATGHIEAARLFLASGADADTEDFTHRSPLSIAIDQGYAELAEEMSKDAKPRIWGFEQTQRAVVTQAAKGHTAMVRFLLSKGVKVDRDLGGPTALIAGAAVGDVELARLLIEHGCPANATSPDGYTALMRACQQGHAAYAEVLLKAGADPLRAMPDGKTALHFAVIRDAEDLIKLLIAHGAKSGVSDRAGYTPLRLALIAGNRRAARELINHGDRLDPARSQAALLQVALQFDLVELIDAALQAGLSATEPLAEDWSPLEIAKLFDAEKCMDALRKAGAKDEADRLVSVRELDAKPKLVAASNPIDPRDVDDKYPQVDVELDAVLSPEGRVLFPSVRKTSDPVLGFSSLLTVRQWQFAPITRNGTPAYVRVRLPLKFPPWDHRVTDLANVDVYPQILKTAPPVYPNELRREGTSGEVTLRFTVGVDGKVHDILVMSSSHRGFNRPAMEALSKWTYLPGEVDGKPVATRMEQPVAFMIAGY
jgi:hypothetical protein